MFYSIRKTQLSDVNALPDIERSAGMAFKSIPSLAWIATDSVLSVDDQERFIEEAFSWVAFEDETEMIVGFIIAEIVEESFHIVEVSVADTHQQKGIGSKLFNVAFSEAKGLGLLSTTLTTFIDVAWNAPYYERLGFVTLTEDEMPSYLKRVLENEAKAGLPRNRRCAMRKVLSFP